MNSEELNAQWNKIFEHILTFDSIDIPQTRALLSRLVPQAMSDGFLMLTADNDFIKKFIESHYSHHIKHALKDLYGKEYMLVIEVDENQHVPSSSISADENVQKKEPPAEAAQTISMRDAAPSQEQKEEPPALSTLPETSIHSLDEESTSQSPTSSLTFENFVIGESNRMAYSMAVAVAEEPGRKMLNPLFIYGKSGLGKTHLMRAIQNYVAETRKDMLTIYIDSSDFLNGYVEATISHDKEKTSFKNFKSHFEEASILLIDDIQYFQGKEQTLDIVFQIFNSMVDQGKQVVLSADRAPKNIVMDERYQSRFNSGGTFDIQPPEVETKLGIIRSFVEEYRTTSNQPQFSIPDDICRYIAENSSSNIRELKSAVTKIIYAMNAYGSEELTIEKVTQLLENHFSGGAMKKLSVADIQKQVEQYYDVSHNELTGQKRDRRIAYARKIAVYLSREMLDLPYNTIGKSFGDRDHSTIMYSITSVEKQMSSNREIREEIENIKRRIKDM